VSAPATIEEAERLPKLSLSDEVELRAYFSSYVPRAPGERSSFGAMCTRLGNARNPRSKQRPTADTPWTEILDCPRSYGSANFDGEDAMVMYLDGRKRFRRVCEALSMLSTCDQRVLDAFYGIDVCEHPLGQFAAVATLTDTANKRHRARAARGLHEPIEVTVRWLAGGTSPDARAAFKLMRDEAEVLLRQARGAYAHARGVGRLGR
jgi:hypothetical protein